MAPSIASSALVLSFNFIAALACISLNKQAFVYFPFPAALTFIHYSVSWAGIELLSRMGRFEKRPIPTGYERAFYSLIACWSACNALSNVSLSKNSVGFYQLAKLMITPSLVGFDYLYYGRRTTPLQAILLLLSCLGVGLASVSDVQVYALGASVATVAVFTAAAQKVLNSHVQQSTHMDRTLMLERRWLVKWQSVSFSSVYCLRSSRWAFLASGDAERLRLHDAAIHRLHSSA